MRRGELSTQCLERVVLVARLAVQRLDPLESVLWHREASQHDTHLAHLLTQSLLLLFALGFLLLFALFLLAIALRGVSQTGCAGWGNDAHSALIEMLLRVYGEGNVKNNKRTLCVVAVSLLRYCTVPVYASRA